MPGFHSSSYAAAQKAFASTRAIGREIAALAEVQQAHEVGSDEWKGTERMKDDLRGERSARYQVFAEAMTGV